MTAVVNPRTRTDESLRVVKGRRLRKPTVAPWVVVALLAMAAFLGMGFAQTSLDRSAFDLAELNRAIATQESLNLELRLKVARMENPARIAPLAEQLGLVIPPTTHQLLVDLDRPVPVLAGTTREDTNQ